MKIRIILINNFDYFRKFNSSVNNFQNNASKGIEYRMKLFVRDISFGPAR